MAAILVSSLSSVSLLPCAMALLFSLQYKENPLFLHVSRSIFYEAFSYRAETHFKVNATFRKSALTSAFKRLFLAKAEERKALVNSIFFEKLDEFCCNAKACMLQFQLSGAR